MSRGYKPQRASDRTDRSNLFSFTKDKILQRHIGPALLRKLNGGEKAESTPINVQRAREYWQKQQGKTRSMK